MHETAYKFIESMVSQMEPRQSVIELGSRTVPGDWPYSGPVRPLFDGAHYVGIDIREGPNVDVVGNAATYQPVYKPVDTVICCETLEHTPEGAGICVNAWRLLHPGGVLILTAAGEGREPHSAVDGGPLQNGEHYSNITRTQLRTWLQPFGFAMIDTSTPGDIYALAVK